MPGFDPRGPDEQKELHMAYQGTNTKRMHICCGTEEFCKAVTQYLNKALTFAQVADFTAHPWSPVDGWEWSPEPGSWEVTAERTQCERYTISLSRTRDVVTDFEGGWLAAGKKSRMPDQFELDQLRRKKEEREERIKYLQSCGMTYRKAVSAVNREMKNGR